MSGTNLKSDLLDLRAAALDAAQGAIEARAAQQSELLEIARLLTLATNEGDDLAQGTHYIAGDGRIRCKGSFLSLIERARAAVAEATGEA